MNANDIIQAAKNIYPVELFLPTETLIDFVNEARKRVNKFAKLTYSEYTFKTVAGAWRYISSLNFYEIFRVTLNLNTVVYLLRPIKLGDFFIRNLRCLPYAYSFVPPNKISLYPTPDNVYEIYLYGYTPLSFQYTVSNMYAQDVIPEHFKAALAYDVARQMANADQQYELAALFEQNFFERMREAKI